MSERRIGLLFPGQGSQRVGMGRDLCDRYPEAAEVFAAARDVLDFDLPRLCFEGPMEELTQTHNAQPALLLHSLAVAAVLRQRAQVKPYLVAGHSLGEFSAAACVGALAAQDALRLVRRRGQLMWQAGQRAPGTMAAVIGLPRAATEEVCREVSSQGPGVVVVANRNSEDQSVISGDVAAVERAAEPLKQAGARRVMPLPVSGAFHSPLMAVVQGEFSEFLSGISIHQPSAPVVANVSAQPVAEPQQLRAGFVEQLVSPVRWHECVGRMVEDRVSLFLEVGPGNVLTNLGARSFRSAQFHSTSDADGLEKTLAVLSDGQ